MSTFETSLLVILGAIAGLLYALVATLGDLRKDVSEIWKRMKRLD